MRAILIFGKLSLQIDNTPLCFAILARIFRVCQPATPNISQHCYDILGVVGSSQDGQI